MRQPYILLATPRLRCSRRHGCPCPAATRSWLKYRVLDAQGNEVATARANVLGTGQWESLQTGVRVQQAGTIEVMASTTGSGPAVYFDNLRVEQTGGLIVQEQHQYAFGAPLPGLSYSVGNRRYRYGYQGQYAEHDSLTGFESFELRLYNSRIGRWMNTDPEGEFDSPYVGMGNNPVSGVDPTGGCTVCPLPTVVITGVSNKLLLPIAARLVVPAISTAVRSSMLVGTSPANGYANGVYVGRISQDEPTNREYYADGAKWVFKDLYDFVDDIYKGLQLPDISGRRDIAGRPVTLRESASGFYSTLYTAATIVAEVPPSTKELRAAGQLPDKGLTRAGRSLEKHGNRPDQLYGLPKGSPAAKNAQGQALLKSIVEDPNALQTIRYHAKFGRILEFRVPSTGRGARFSADGKAFIGFL